jgi:hypothetical protein
MLKMTKQFFIINLDQYTISDKSSLVSLERYRINTDITETSLGEFAAHLAPELIAVFDDRSNLPAYIELNTNILFYDEEGFYYYDKNRKPEEDILKITDRIANSLNDYVEEERGREHDRVILAFNRIGEELGYVTQREYGKAGVRIDNVWFDNNGEIKVAIEVETTSTWKKDLISTWEVEPELAVIVGFPKTDATSKNLLESSLMKNIPHYVLYINKHTNHAFLFDKQEIIQHYVLKEARE